MAAAAMLNFAKMLFRALMTFIWPMYICIPNFTQGLGPTVAQYMPLLIKIQNGGSRHRIYIFEPYLATISHRHLNFNKSIILGPQWPLYGANQIWCKSIQKLLRYTCLCISNMAAVRHLGCVLTQFWTIPDVPVDGLNFHGVMIRSDVTWDIAILRLPGFGCKMPIRANFRQSWGILTA